MRTVATNVCLWIAVVTLAISVGGNFIPKHGDRSGVEWLSAGVGPSVFFRNVITLRSEDCRRLMGETDAQSGNLFAIQPGQGIKKEFPPCVTVKDGSALDVDTFLPAEQSTGKEKLRLWLGFGFGRSFPKTY